MSKFEKLVDRIFNGKNVSYDDAANLLSKLGFQFEIRGSHHTFRKPGFFYPYSGYARSFSEILEWL